MANLLPCPFCGCPNIRYFKPFERKSYRVDCNFCNAGVDRPDPDQATAAWNRRAANHHDALMEALEDIASSDDVDNALDPERNKRVARAALAAVRGQK